MSYQVLARKYRPKQLKTVVGQHHVVQALTNALTQQSLHHAYLFTGTRGIGKTTVARNFAKSLSCQQGITANPCLVCDHCQEIGAGRFPDFFEVDAASRTKVEDTRELLDNVPYSPVKGRFKIYLIDEVHMLSGHSFNALLKTLEEPPSHVKFLLATTDHQKLPATVLSRCLQFHLQATSPSEASNHMSDILKQEQIQYDSTALQLIGQAANGSMRDALSLLDQCIAYGNGQVLEADVSSMLGIIRPTALFKLLTSLSQREGHSLITEIDTLEQQGVNFKSTLKELLTLLHQISLVQTVPGAPCGDYEKEKKALAQAISAEDTQLFYQIGVMGHRDFDFAPSPRTAFEMTLLRMLAFYPETNAKVSLATEKQTTAGRQQHQPSAVESGSKSLNNDSWDTLVSRLQLTGAAAILAQHCSLTKITETQAHLSVNEKQRALASPRAIQRISEALSRHLGRNIIANISVCNVQQITPALQKQQQHNEHQKSAKMSLSSDPKLQQLLQTFDATLIEDSIQTKVQQPKTKKEET